MKLAMTALNLWYFRESATVDLDRERRFPSKYDPEGTELSRGRLVTTLLIYEIKKGEISLFGGSEGMSVFWGC